MKDLKNIFVGKSTEVIRVLLVSYPKEWRLRELAKESGVSLRLAAVAAGALIRERLALRASPRSELKVMAPLDLLKRWATVNNFAANTKFIEYYSGEEDVSKFLASFKGKKGPEYVFTGLAGALLVAPFVRPTNVHLYVKNEEDAKKWAELLSLMPVEGNGNVKFAIANNKNVFYGAREVNGATVVSAIQLYVDLLNYPGRGEEAAGEVYKTIEKQWKI
ncbi:MAG: type IV toxin-antitoxin system AbiEi family antitoxin [Candidatus ainarchaeum sp.]|nr:type IV toxin-antitoxin system AbiEi family antitoxin [Candidatus ainarchaeum sp.]